jgi:hypothetical protein
MTPADTVRPCDFSPVIQSRQPLQGQLHAGGYFLQFGGAGNTLNRILRDGVELHGQSVDRFIEPGRVHHMIAEFDGLMVRLIVDDVTIMEAPDTPPLVGPDRGTVGPCDVQRGPCRQCARVHGRARVEGGRSRCRARGQHRRSES